MIIAFRILAVALALAAFVTPARANDISIARVNTHSAAGRQFIDFTVTTVAKEKIDLALFQLVVHFYVRNAQGAIVPVEGDAVSRWLTPPVDWGSGPETLQLECPVGKGSTYFGVVMGLYYKGRIQASYIYPGSLADDLPDEVHVAR